jgi:hypothetical protein
MRSTPNEPLRGSTIAAATAIDLSCEMEMDIARSRPSTSALGAPLAARVISMRRAHATRVPKQAAFITASLAASVPAKWRAGSGVERQ